MENLDKYRNIFVEVFNVPAEAVGPDFKKDTVEAWDSVHQLNIMALLEETFDVMLDPEDILALTSFDAGLEILRKYDVEI
ncbi:MAG: acyl carrier protein [Bacteroidales bacterium]|nr:acyl carrier protein [Bacteroidales bacterium]